VSQRIPETPNDVTPEWLTAVLTEAGVLQAGRVVAAQWERVGEEYGFTGVVGRVELRYDGLHDQAPASLIVKLPMAKSDTMSGHRAVQERDQALMQRYYERCVRELRFYRDIGAGFAPRVYYSAADEPQQRVVLLLEDLSGGRQGEVLEGCSIEDARLVIDQLAPFHARWWGQPALASGFPVGGRDPRERQERYARHVDLFMERCGDRLPPGISDIVEELRSRLGDVASALYARQKTLIHADLHLDNLLFDARGDGRSVAVLDWQTVSVGPPAWDVTLFLFGSLSVEDRRAAESELFDRYVGLLSTHGVRGYSSEDLRHECGLAVLLLLAGTIGWLATIDRDASPRERALQDAVLHDGRLLTAVLDHGEGLL
jgi:hypothetical protein